MELGSYYRRFVRKLHVSKNQNIFFNNNLFHRVFIKNDVNITILGVSLLAVTYKSVKLNYLLAHFICAFEILVLSENIGTASK